jgi:hypothetical protein
MGWAARRNHASREGRKHPQDVGYVRLQRRPIVDLVIEAIWSWLAKWR